MHATRKRIFFGFYDIALYQSMLKKGFESLGWRVTRVVFSDDLQFGKDDSEKILVFRWVKKIERWNLHCWKQLDAVPKTHLMRLVYAVWRLRLSAILKRIFNWLALFWTIANHDVIVLSYCSSFLERSDHTMEPANRSFPDLKWIKRCGRMLVCTFHGSDSKPPYIDAYVMRNARRLSPEQVVELTRSRKRLVSGIEKLADSIVNVPAGAYFHTRPFVLHEYLGRPFSWEDGFHHVTRSRDNPVVVHAPSNPHCKGTHVLRPMIERLKSKGLKFEYVEVTGLPHGEIMKLLAKASLLIDQVYSDRFIHGISTEALYCGTPVILSGYYADYYRADYEGRIPLPPVVFCRPEELETELEKLIQDPERLERLGKQGRAYVRERFDPIAVARRWVDMIEGRLPPEAFYDPYTLRYPYGVGLSKDELKENIRMVLEIGGREALCLADKPELEAAMVALAR